MSSSEKAARIVFRIAGAWGILILPPHYFAEQFIGDHHPPAITHPEFFYGFLGVGIAWQIAFLIIGHDPVRFRPLIPAALFEKFSFGIAAVILAAMGRVPLGVLASGVIDMLFGVAFAICYQALRSAKKTGVEA